MATAAAAARRWTGETARRVARRTYGAAPTALLCAVSAVPSHGSDRAAKVAQVSRRLCWQPADRAAFTTPLRLELLAETTPNPLAMRFTAARARAARSFLAAGNRGVVELCPGGSEGRLEWLAHPAMLGGLVSRPTLRAVLVGPGFISVSLTEEPPEGWDALQGELEAALGAALAGAGAAQDGQAGTDDAILSEEDGVAEEDLPLQQRVERLLDRKVRPNLHSDGGDVEVRGVSPGGVVRLRLLGSCRSCPSSTVTLKFSISNLLRHEFPGEVTAVEQVFDEGDTVEAKGEGWTG